MRRATDEEEFDAREFRSEKIPRWALLLMAGIMFSICGFFIKNIYADAIEAKKLAEKHETAMPFIQASLQRLDQRQDKMDDKLDKILLAVRN